MVGTGVVRLLGRELTGKAFGDGVPADLTETRTDEFRKALATGEAILSCSSLMQENRNFIDVIRGVFPADWATPG